MKYLLDTCAVSDYFRRDQRVVRAMHAVAPHELAITTITEHEIRFGLARQPQLTSSLSAKVKTFLSVIQVLPFTSADAEASAKIRARLEKGGKGIVPFDVLIAGVAVARDLVLVTSNEKEFARVSELSVENWRHSD